MGGRVHYREWPSRRRGGPTFLLVHGLGGSWLNWALVAPSLAEHGTVIALDLPGFGLTPTAGRRGGLPDNRRLLSGFIRALDLAPVILVGNSMGGLLAIDQAVAHGELISGLVLTDAALPHTRSSNRQMSPIVALGFAVTGLPGIGPWAVEERLRRLGPQGSVWEALQSCTPDPWAIDPELVGLMADQLEARAGAAHDGEARVFSQATRSLVAAYLNGRRFRRELRRIDAPALLIHGRLDPLVPVAAARDVAARRPDWTLEIFDGVGHVPQMEVPGAWLASVERWLAGRAA